jgi:hypothetical protein
MDLCRRSAFALFGQGLIHRFHGFDPIVPFLIGCGVENYETGFPFYGEHQGPVAPLKQTGELGCLTLEGSERMNVFRNVNHVGTSKASYQMLGKTTRAARLLAEAVGSMLTLGREMEILRGQASARREILPLVAIEPWTRRPAREDIHGKWITSDW